MFVVRSFASSSAGGLTDKAPGQGTANKVVNPSTDKEKIEDQVADTEIFRTLAKYLWAKDNLEYRVRFVSALVLLAGAKVGTFFLSFGPSLDILHCFYGSNFKDVVFMTYLPSHLAL